MGQIQTIFDRHTDERVFYGREFNSAIGHRPNRNRGRSARYQLENGCRIVDQFLKSQILRRLYSKIELKRRQHFEDHKERLVIRAQVDTVAHRNALSN